MQIFNKIIAKWILKHTKKNIHHSQADFISEMQSWIDIQKSVNVID